METRALQNLFLRFQTCCIQLIFLIRTGICRFNTNFAKLIDLFQRNFNIRVAFFIF